MQSFRMRLPFWKPPIKHTAASLMFELICPRAAAAA